MPEEMMLFLSSGTLFYVSLAYALLYGAVTGVHNYVLRIKALFMNAKYSQNIIGRIFDLYWLLSVIHVIWFLMRN